MPKLSRASVSLDVEPGAVRPPERPEPDTPFRVLLIGDFSGRANRRVPAPPKRKAVLVDRDNFDRVLAGMGAELHLSRQEPGVVLQFRDIDDFHPDRIFERSPLFEKLRDTRRKLADPATFAEAAAALGAAPPPSGKPARPPEQAPPPSGIAALAGGGLLDDILEDAETQTSRAARRPDELRAFIERAVAPHIAPREAPELPHLMAQVDASASGLMRAILHHPDFQALEAAWRAVALLVRGIETGPDLKLYLLDMSKAELAAGLSELRRLLVEETSVAGAQPWAVIAGNFTFGRTVGDVALLERLGNIAAAAGAPFLAEADPASEPASAEAERRWEALRRSPQASWIGLALPRFLLRLPYGAQTDRVENFAFEEMLAAPEHQNYLWGNPGFACAYLLCQAFSSDGWDLRPGTHQEIQGLPLHVYEADGEQQVKPCAEVWMTERDADWIMEQGFMPLASMKNQDTVRLLRFQSIADPPGRLSGRWD